MTDISLEMTCLSVAWLSAVIFVAHLCQTSRSGSVGLPAAFLFCMTFHYCSVFIYCVPGYSHLRLDALTGLERYNGTESTVLAGAIVTTFAVVSFAAGVWLGMSRGPAPAVRGLRRRPLNTPDNKRVLMITASIAAFGFVLGYLQIEFAAIQAFRQVTQNLGIISVCIGFHIASLEGNKRARTGWMLAGLFIPIWYLVFFGMMSAGFIAATIILGYLLANAKAKPWSLPRLVTTTFVGGYLCLSVFTVYMSFRNDIRSVVWGGGELSDRVAVVGNALSNMKLLNPFDFTSLDYIALRLNQAAFVGRTIEWHDIFPELRTYGTSLIFSLLAWVPRAMWPTKPEMGHSTMLEVNTGMKFSERAVFGAGQVVEFYVNFGTIGVIGGFLLLGYIVTRLDIGAAIALHTGRFLKGLRNFAVGVALVSPLTDIFFIVSTLAASWLVATGLGFALEGVKTSSGRSSASAQELMRRRRPDLVREGRP